MDRISYLLSEAKRPLIVAGNGIRLSGQQQRFWSFIQRHQFPFVTTWTGADLVPTAHQMNCGILGISGQRGANKAVHNADLLLVLGSHLSLPQTSTLTDQFAPKAKKIIVDIDSDQLDNLTVEVDLKICADLKMLFDWFVHHEKMVVEGDHHDLGPKISEEWKEECRGYKSLNNTHHAKPQVGINSYVFNEMMTKMLPNGTCMVIDGGGTTLYTGFQSSYVKAGSRLICSTSMSAMGSGLPEAIGACLANGRRLTTCLIGDGSLMLNVQELQTIVHHRLPIKIFVINNGGYLAIKHTQDGFLEGRRYGVGGEDLTFPSIQNLAAAFRLAYHRVTREDAVEQVGRVLDLTEPTLTEVMCPEDQEMLWKQGYKKVGEKFVPQNLEEMAPFV